MILFVKIAKLLVNMDPKFYMKYVITSKQVVPMLYVKMTKDIYVMLSSYMLLYKKLRIHIEEIGFETNPYDPCVDNMTINSSQITVCWHVDYPKLSHK